MKTQDPLEKIAIRIRNYIKGTSLLISAVETYKKLEWFLHRDFALRIILRTLTEVQFLDELRELEIYERAESNKKSEEVDEVDDTHDFMADEVKHSIINTKLSRNQLLEADWEARKLGVQASYGRTDIIMKKIEQGPAGWIDVIDDIAFIDDSDVRLMLYCELAEAAICVQHPNSAHFFKLVHDTMNQVVVPDTWKDDPSPLTHPLYPLASLYGAAKRYEDYVSLVKRLPQPDRDVLIYGAIETWVLSETDLVMLLTLVDEIEHRLEKVSALCTIAFLQASESRDLAVETLNRAEQLLSEAQDDEELYDLQRHMTAGEIMKVKLEIGSEELDAYEMDEGEELVSNLLNLELNVVDKALEKGHVRKARKLADEIRDDKQQAIAYGWIAFEHIRRGQSERAYALLAKDLSSHQRLRPIAELMWRLLNAPHGLFYNHVGPYITLAVKTATADLKDHMNDELRESYIRVLVYAGQRLVNDAGKALATSDPSQRSKQLQAEFLKALQARHFRHLPKLALLLTSEDKGVILDKLKDRERNIAEAAMLACEL